MRFRSPACGIFFHRLRAVVGARYDGACPGGAADAADPGQVWLSAAEAAAHPGVRPDRIVEAVRTGRMAGRLRKSGVGHRHCTVPRAAVAAELDGRRRVLTRSATAAHLGVGGRQLALLIEAGVVREQESDAGPALADGGIDRGALDGLVRDLRPGAEPRQDETIRLRHLTPRRTTDRRALRAVLGAVATGRIPVVTDAGGARFGDLAVLAAAVEGILAEHRRPAGLTTREVAAITGWTHHCVAHWCADGLLASRGCAHAGRLARVVDPADLARFQVTYVPVATLARRLGTSSRSLLHRLGRIGIPVHGQFEEAGAMRGALVEIADLPRLSLPARRR